MNEKAFDPANRAAIVFRASYGFGQTMTPTKWFVVLAGFMALLAPVSVSCQDESQDVPVRQESRLERNNRILVSQLSVAVRRAMGQLRAGDPRLADYEKSFAEASRLQRTGRSGEARREYYRLLTVLSGREWTSRDEYGRSLVLRLDTPVHDPAGPLIVRLSQSYPASYAPKGPLRIRASLMRPPGAQPRHQPAKTVLDLGTYDGIPADLIDEPFPFAGNVRGQPDGNYLLAVELQDGDDSLTRLATPVCLVGGFAAERDEAERRLSAIQGHESAKASVRYPFDCALKVNLGLLELRGLDFAASVKRSKEILAELEKGADLVWQKIGFQKRHYWLAEANEIMPYCLYVPKAYDGARAFPLIVALHGNGGTEDTMLPGENSLMAKLAEQYGYVVASPKGYRPDGGYGGKTEGEWDPAKARASRFSEMDVMNVLRLVRSEYKIDDNRTYLMGHSGGGGGTWRLGAKYPDIWAALGPIASAAGGFSPDNLERMRHIPVVVCHGDADAVAPVSASRTLVARMKELGMTHQYWEIPRGTHALVIPSLPYVFEFFNLHQRASKP